MKRREFGQKFAGGIAAASGLGALPGQAARAPRKNTLMHVGGDYHSVAGAGISSKENLEYNLRYGVKHLTAQPSERARTAVGIWMC